MKYIENSSSFHLGETYRDDPPTTLLPCGIIYQKRRKDMQISVDLIKDLTRLTIPMFLEFFTHTPDT